MELAGRVLFARRLPAAGGEPAMFVHGLSWGASAVWLELMAALHPRIDALAVDLPGFGASPPPDDRVWLAAAMEATWPRPGHLVGHSYGGIVALTLAARRPELVASLMLLAPAAPQYRLSSGRHLALGLLAVPGVERLALAWARRQADPVRAARSVAAIRSIRELAAGYLRFGEASARGCARRIRCPALVVVGDADPIVPVAAVARLATMIPGSRLLVLAGAGHRLPVERTELLAREFRLLSGREDCAVP